MAYQPKHLINVHTHHRRDRDFEDHLAEWTRDGADVTCVACVGRDWEDAGYNQFQNADMAPWIAKHPDRLIGMAFVETAEPLDDASVIDHWHGEGFRGIKMICPDAPYHDEKYWPFYERAQELKMPILFHCGLVGGRPGTALHARSYSEYMRPYFLENVARRFPDLRVLGAHLGKPHVHEAFALMRMYPNVLFDFSGASGARDWQEEIILSLHPRPGADWASRDENPALRYFPKLCFATDNPPVARWRAASEHIMDVLHVPDALREDFYWRNAARMFELDRFLEDDEQAGGAARDSA